MTRNLRRLCILSLGLASLGFAQGPASPANKNTHYTQAQLKQMVRDAQTPEQYRVLAAYYAQRQNTYLQEAADEKQEWLRRSQNSMGIAAKYPRPADSARNLYEYYAYEATKSGQMAVKYSQLSAPEPSAKAK